MDRSELQPLIEQILNEALLHNWKYWLVYGATAFLVFVAANLISPYLRTRAQSYATKVDFDILLQQVRAQAEATARINAMVSHGEWTLQEYKKTKRHKLELLVELALELREWIFEYRRAILYCRKHEASEPLPKFRMLQALYFPELNKQATAVSVCFRDAHRFLIQVDGALLGFPDNMARVDEFDKSAPEFNKLNSDLHESILAFNDSAHAIMHDLMRVVQS